MSEIEKSEAEQMLEEIAIKEAADFLRDSEIKNELERESAFGGYCCGFIKGFTMAIKALKNGSQQ
jgi:hypothetical protein